jgi:hypothetical protein
MKFFILFIAPAVHTQPLIPTITITIAYLQVLPSIEEIVLRSVTFGSQWSI